MKELTPTSLHPLNDGHAIPRLGFGLFQLTDPEVTRRAVLTALETGYRHLDDAAVYDNEEQVGKALIESGVPRKELFLTSKCWISDFGREKTRDAFQQSLDRLQTDYLDLYLLHWPVDETMMEAWETLVELQQEGLCRSVGVSNFSVARLKEGFFPHTDAVPAVNQIERHPRRSQPDVLEYCAQQDIALESYSPLARGEVLDHPVLKTVAGEAGKTAAQVVLRWQLQHDCIVIPKSATPERIRENFDLFDFELNPDQMAKLDGMDENASVIGFRPNDGEGWY